MPPGQFPRCQRKGMNHDIFLRGLKRHVVDLKEESGCHEAGTLVAVKKRVVLNHPESISRSQLKQVRSAVRKQVFRPV